MILKMKKDYITLKNLWFLLKLNICMANYNSSYTYLYTDTKQKHAWNVYQMAYANDTREGYSI